MFNTVQYVVQHSVKWGDYSVQYVWGTVFVDDNKCNATHYYNVPGKPRVCGRNNVASLCEPSYAGWVDGKLYTSPLNTNGGPLDALAVAIDAANGCCW